MTVLQKYTVGSILKIGILTALLASLMLMGVDLFKNLDTYMSMQVQPSVVLKITLLYFPEAFVFALGPAFLFAVSYYLSSLNAENELISVLNAGVSHFTLVLPCIITGLIVSLFYLCFNESVALNTTNKKNELFNIATYSGSETADNYSIALSDMHSGFMVYSAYYSDEEKALYYVVLIQTDENGKLISRTDAEKAVWNNETKDWTFENCNIFTPKSVGLELEKVHVDSVEMGLSYLKPEMFKNMSSSIDKLNIKEAKEYLNSIKILNQEQYAALGTDFYSRVLGCLTPLVMVIIAVFSNVRFKKNVLVFTIILSVCVSVVYYVARIITVMLANQGVIAPYWGTLLPFAAVGILALITSSFRSR